MLHLILCCRNTFTLHNSFNLFSDGGGGTFLAVENFYGGLEDIAAPLSQCQSTRHFRLSSQPHSQPSTLLSPSPDFLCESKKERTLDPHSEKSRPRTLCMKLQCCRRKTCLHLFCCLAVCTGSSKKIVPCLNFTVFIILWSFNVAL